MASPVNHSKARRYDHMAKLSLEDTEKLQRQSLSQRQIFWQPPVFMSLSFILGVACAILHHCFYSHWNKVDLDNAWPQIWISRIGTTLAFLTKVFLAVASSIAYVQQQWLVMHKNTFQLQEADTLFGILSDATFFLDVRIWLRHPLLTIPALVTWYDDMVRAVESALNTNSRPRLVPIAAVITPGSLTVVNPNVTSVQSHHVPQLTFDNTAYAYSNSGLQSYWRARENVERLSRSTAMFGAIPQLPYPARNASYQLTYFTPALRCSNAAATLAQKFTAFNEYSLLGSRFVYLSFVPSDGTWTDLNFNKIAGLVGDGANVPWGPLRWNNLQWGTIDSTPWSAATLYIIAKDLKDTQADYYYIGCQFWNVTQTARFDFSFPSQVITIESPIRYLHSVSAYNYTYGYDNLGHDKVDNSQGMAYIASMDMFGKVIVGGIAATRDNNSNNLVIMQTSSQFTQVDWSSRDTAINGLEQLFQNMTLSLMTDALLVKTPAQADNISVSVTTYPSRYSYSWRQLCLAYGISTSCTLFCVVVGVQALVRNDASFSNRCSTILRAFRGSKLEILLSVTDDGADPLPGKLKNVQVAL